MRRPRAKRKWPAFSMRIVGDQATSLAVLTGGTVAHGFVASLTARHDAYRWARQSPRGPDTTEAETFYNGASAVLETLNKEYARSGLDTSFLDSAELKDAFDEVPQCR